MLGWQLQVMLMQTARQTCQRSMTCNDFGDMPSYGRACCLKMEQFKLR